MDISEKDFESVVEAALIGAAASTVAEPVTAYGGDLGTFGAYVKRGADKYDRALCLLPDDVIGFILATQPQTWEKLKAQYGESQVRDRFLKRLASEIGARGTLDVLRGGLKDLGCKFELAYFRPETTFNEEHRRLSEANLFAVVRQLHFSRANEKSLDAALFLNGLPLLTIELKNPLTGQTVQDAIQQYRHDRDPKEPLFKADRCLVHFAVDTDLAYMTTALRGPATRFLPFNRGDKAGAGNPVNPRGFKTAYLWERIWQPETLLEIVGKFAQEVDARDENGQKTGKKQMIFPRYHQWDAVRRMVSHARQHGAGSNYLVQHSAGSGKSNSIAWLTHQLSGLHDGENRRVFDSVIVVTDRTILDDQLRETVRSFEQVRGVVTAIEKGGSKSADLAAALESGGDIIVTTLQTFPFVAERLGTVKGRRFAVVIDEAHSSQSGETNRSLRETFSVPNADAQEPDDPDSEDGINAAVEAAMRSRGRLPNVSFFAFTATPKNKTLELFGTRGTDGKPEPFHLYSMRQAIDEGFILDVLQNYTTYQTYFALRKKIAADPNYDRKKATALLRAYADLHEHAIESKVEIMVEHFHSQVQGRIGGQAKAMIVTRSRLHAVRYRQAFDRYLKATKYPYRPLVAFSGEVTDPATGSNFTEARMNGVAETQTAETFKGAEFRFLIVANKFQTGFDQPLLHTMYVDKKLGGVAAVQTLSRLNRTHADKEETFVLDFANAAEEIQEAFQPYYTTTLLSETTDPNKLYELQRLIAQYHLYGQADVARFAKAYFAPKGTQQGLQPVLNEIVARYDASGSAEQEGFRGQVGNFVRLYAFLSQIIPFQDADLEKEYQLARFLLRKLPVTRERLPVEITENINMDSYRVQKTSSGVISLLNEAGELAPIVGLGTGQGPDGEVAPLSQIVQYINDNYGTEFTDADRVRHFADDMGRRLGALESLRLALDAEINPSLETRKLAFKGFFEETLEDMMDANFDIYSKLNQDPHFAALFQSVMFDREEKRLREPEPTR